MEGTSEDVCLMTSPRSYMKQMLTTKGCYIVSSTIRNDVMVITQILLSSS